MRCGATIKRSRRACGFWTGRPGCWAYATGPRALPSGEDEEEMIGAAMDALDVTLREISRRRPDVLPGEIEP